MAQRGQKGSGEMTVREAGHLGGEKGGQKVRELIKKGEEIEAQKGSRR
ncbi:MAG: Em GEA1 (EM1) [Armatimonadota bacterium]